MADASLPSVVEVTLDEHFGSHCMNIDERGGMSSAVVNFKFTGNFFISSSSFGISMIVFQSPSSSKYPQTPG